MPSPPPASPTGNPKHRERMRPVSAAAWVRCGAAGSRKGQFGVFFSKTTQNLPRSLGNARRPPQIPYSRPRMRCRIRPRLLAPRGGGKAGSKAPLRKAVGADPGFVCRGGKKMQGSIRAGLVSFGSGGGGNRSSPRLRNPSREIPEQTQPPPAVQTDGRMETRAGEQDGAVAGCGTKRRSAEGAGGSQGAGRDILPCQALPSCTQSASQLRPSGQHRDRINMHSLKRARSRIKRPNS